MSAKKVLFISHDASQTGAPIIFLNFLAWFKNNTEIPVRILLKERGELDSQFKALAPAVFFKKPCVGNGWSNRILSISRLQSVINRVHLQRIKMELLQDNIGLIYSNTITNGEVLEFLSTLECPVITHVHEMNYWIHRMGSNNLNQVKKYTHHYIAVSEAVKRNLVCNHGIPDTMIDVVHGFIPSETFTYRTDKEKKLRKSLNIPDDSFIVGSSGYETWRKGKDLFVQLALNTVSKYKDRDVHFVWIGGQSDGNDFYRIKHDVQLANLSDKVHFVAHVANPLDYFQEFDVFAMLSREDPFPLVNLELAALGKPIVCFDNAGGTPEFVGNDAGYVVPYLDISAMADRIITLAGDVNLRERLGANGLHKVREHHDIRVGAPKIVKIIERFLHSTS